MTKKTTVFWLDDIRASAQETFEKTGERVGRTSGRVNYGPLKNQTTWLAIHKALQSSRTSPKTRHNTLPAYLDSIELGFVYLNEKNIVEAARLTVQHEGRRPTKEDEWVQYGELKGKIKWRAIHVGAVNKWYGLEQSPHDTLAAILDANYVPRQTISASVLFNNARRQITQLVADNTHSDWLPIANSKREYNTHLHVTGAFLANAVKGLDAILIKKNSRPTTLREFILATGLAIEDKDRNLALPPDHKRTYTKRPRAANKPLTDTKAENDSPLAPSQRKKLAAPSKPRQTRRRDQFRRPKHPD